MSQPIAVNILSDDEDGDCGNEALSTPLQTQSKKQRLLFDSNPTVFVIDDDPTPRKPSSDPISTPSFVAETPLSDFSIHSVSVVKCPIGLASSSMFEPKSPGINKLICLESDNESEIGSWRKTWKQNETTVVASQVGGDLELNPKYLESSFSLCDNSLHQIALEDDIPQAHDVLGKEIDGLEPITKDLRQKGKTKHSATTENKMDEASRRKRITKEERTQMMEEKKQQKEQERLQKAALKAEAAEMKKLQKEMQKWEKGKVALKSIMAEIDTKVVELGSVGGHLLTGFGEKGLSYRVTSNPIARSIVWTMTVPEQILQIASRCSEIAYVLLVYDAEEFCSLILNGSLMDHVSSVQSRYPSHTICFLTNRLMAYINRREQGQYKNPDTYVGWRRPPVEEALSKLSTHFFGVHSRQCVDEAELADHVVGLTCSLASCQFRKKLTRLSVNANGSLIPKDCVDRALIKKNSWLKALVAIPKVQPRFAIAIWKKYPTMKSLLSVYMDPSRSVHEKEFLLKDLTTEGLLSEDRRLGEVCSKRIYRILMAQSGNIRTDDVEEGADFFR